MGKLCTQDRWIHIYGTKIWHKYKARVGNKMEVRESVIRDMRELASLYTCFKKHKQEPSSSSIDMFLRPNFSALEMAIIEVTAKDDDGVKH